MIEHLAVGIIRLIEMDIEIGAFGYNVGIGIGFVFPFVMSLTQRKIALWITVVTNHGIGCLFDRASPPSYYLPRIGTCVVTIEC